MHCQKCNASIYPGGLALASFSTEAKGPMYPGIGGEGEIQVLLCVHCAGELAALVAAWIDDRLSLNTRVIDAVEYLRGKSWL